MSNALNFSSRYLSRLVVGLIGVLSLLAGSVAAADRLDLLAVSTETQPPSWHGIAYFLVGGLLLIAWGVWQIHCDFRAARGDLESFGVDDLHD